MTTRPLWSLLLVAACGYEAPVDPAPVTPSELNAIEGTVVFAGAGDVGPTFVTVYDADNPGPPVGTGGPVTFATVAPRSYTGEGAGLQSASYGVTQLEDGAYIVNALVDVDADFSPFSDVLAGATCGDWVGTHITDLATLGTALVEVKGGEAKRDVTVFVGQPMTSERPVFTFQGESSLSLEAAATSPLPPTYRLQASGAFSAFSEEVSVDLGPACPADADTPACDAIGACPCEDDGANPCDTALWVYIVDEDADGAPDPYPAELQAAAGIYNIFPRVFIEFVGEELGTFKHEGQTLPERWVGENFPLAAEIAIAELGGGTAADIAPVGVPTPMNQMSVTFSPVFRHYHADGTFGVDANGPYDLLDLRLPEYSPADVPQGAWKATVILHTGQTWNVPNDIGLLGLPGGGTFDPTTQAASLTLGP